MTMSRVGLALSTMLFALCFSAEAQQAKKIPRVGFLSTGLPSSPYIEAFQQGLRDLGYIEGKNIIVEYRFGEAKLDRIPDLATEMVGLKVDIIVVDTSTAARAAKKVTTAIPIVMANGSDPIGIGLVASLARPGGNVTGLTNYSSELLGKRLELLKEVVPKVSRFAFLNDAGGAASSGMFKEAQVAATALGVKLQLVEVKPTNPDLEGAFRVMVRERIGALITSPSPPISFHRKRILELLEQNRIPAIHPFPQWMDAGGLMYYGANTVELVRRAAAYVDKILKGRKPADLPVEQPTKFEFIINLKTAKQIGLTISPNVLARADKVIR
jgi:putative tryptophan/tyrosine transport system substrate-binding protein